MSTEKCMGCNGVFSTDWPPETRGASSLKQGLNTTDYWYVCPHCNGKNFVTRDDENNVTIDRFEEAVKKSSAKKSDGDSFSPMDPTGKVG
ncbi:MAG: hypothetical protein V3U15_01950 [Nitrospinota bacterium]